MSATTIGALIGGAIDAMSGDDSAADGALGGITRRLMFDLAREAGREITEANLTRYDIFVADELFCTGTGAEVVPITDVDGRKIGKGTVGPVTQEFIKSFKVKTQSGGTPIY